MFYLYVKFQAERQHMVFKATSSEVEKCGNDHGKWLPFNELHKGEFIRNLKMYNFEKVKYLEG